MEQGEKKKQELLSVMDENAILITVEFIEKGARLKNSSRIIERFERDFIVQNTITCRQLLEAVQKGLSDELEALNIDVAQYDTKIIYCDEKTDGGQQREKTPPGARPSLLEKAWEYLKSMERGLDQRLGLDRNPEPERPAEQVELPPEERLLMCWCVFNTCMDAYNANYRYTVTDENGDTITEPMARPFPVIGRGSISMRDIPEIEILSYSDQAQVWLDKEKHHEKSLRELGFITTSRLVFDPVGWHTSSGLFKQCEVDQAFQKEVPNYNISDNPLYRLDDTPISIVPPTPPPQKNQQSLMSLLASGVVMAISMVGMRMFSGIGRDMESLLPMALGMAGVMMLVAVLNRWVQNADQTKAVENWRKQYEQYIRQLLSRIHSKQDSDIVQLQNMFPPVCSDHGDNLLKRAFAVKSDIFSRNQENPDFLTVRLGLSAPGSQLVPSVFDIMGEKRESVFESVRYRNIRGQAKHPFEILLPEQRRLDEAKTDGSHGFLIDLPRNIAREYACLEGAPVLLHMKECRSLGVVFKDPQMDFQPFLSNLLLYLCYYQSPDDLQCVMLCPPTESENARQNIVRCYRHLPHFRELLGDMSAFAFDGESAREIFNRLLEILNERREISEKAGAGGGKPKFPHIIVFVLEEYEIKRHPVAEYLPEHPGDTRGEEYGISFVFCKRYTQKLPRYCGQVIELTEDGKWYLLPHDRILSNEDGEQGSELRERYGFTPDRMTSQTSDQCESEREDDYHRAFKTISALHYERVAQGADIPTQVDMFSMLDEGKYREKLLNNMPVGLGGMLEQIEGLLSECSSAKEAVEQGEDENGAGETVQKDNTGALTNTSGEESNKQQTTVETGEELWHECSGTKEGEPWAGTLDYELAKLGECVKTGESLLSDCVQIVQTCNKEDAAVFLANKKDALIQLQKEIRSRISSSVDKSLEKFLVENWKKENQRDVTQSLAVPIGRNASGIVTLDLHERAEGPHMLVAGTTGSGKSEAMLTLLMSLCTHYTPEQVNLLLVDMKAGGFSDRLKDLPHVVGVVTDMDADNSGSSRIQIMNRFLRAIYAEISKREKYLREVGVDNLDDYIRACRDPETYVAQLTQAGIQSPCSIDELKEKPVLAHLFLVVDEFAELAKFSKENDGVDYVKAISKVATIGRSLGFHIILVSQNIEGAITDEIRVNSKARFCLKVATKEASRVMLQSDVAANPHMPGNGRAYLLIGTGTRWDYFQSAYSGADINPGVVSPVRITEASICGKYREFYNSSRNVRMTQVGVNQQKMLVKAIAGCWSKMNSPQKVFLEALPRCCCYVFNGERGKGEIKTLQNEGM